MKSRLQLIDHWVQSKNLPLNVAKTHMLFNRSHLNTRSICTRILHLERVNQTIFLGIDADSKFSFEVHIDRLSKYLSGAIGAERR